MRGNGKCKGPETRESLAHSGTRWKFLEWSVGSVGEGREDTGALQGV